LDPGSDKRSMRAPAPPSPDHAPSRLDESTERAITALRPIFTVSILARRKPDVSPEVVQINMNRLAEMLRVEYHVFPTKFRWDLTIGASPLQ
jgi:hypothetical protein